LPIGTYIEFQGVEFDTSPPYCKGYCDMRLVQIKTEAAPSELVPKRVI
jgi:hypothetical protein